MGCAWESEGDEEEVEVKTPVGLLMNHAYGILHVEEVNGTLHPHTQLPAYSTHRNSLDPIKKPLGKL